MRRRERGGVAHRRDGLVAVLALLLAVLRPVRIAARESVVGARVVVLADASRSMALPRDGNGATRASTARDRALAALAKNAHDARLLVLGFGDGAPPPLDGREASATRRRTPGRAAERSHRRAPRARELAGGAPRGRRRRLATAASTIRPRARPTESARARSAAELERADPHDRDDARRPRPTRASAASRPRAPRSRTSRCRSASRSAAAAGSSCDELTVTARELRDDGPPALLASGLAHLKDGKGTVDLTVTLERAGARILEIAITPPARRHDPRERSPPPHVRRRPRARARPPRRRPADERRARAPRVAEERRLGRRRRVLHPPHARPTTRTRAHEDLALIPFPVDELFTRAPALVRRRRPAGLRRPAVRAREAPPRARALRARRRRAHHGRRPQRVRRTAATRARRSRERAPGRRSTARPGATAADVDPVRRPRGRSTGAPRRCSRRSAPSSATSSRRCRAPTSSATCAPAASCSGRTRRARRSSGAPMPVLAIGEQGDGRTIALGIDGALAARVLAARRAHGGARPRRAVGRAPRLADARPALRAGAARARRGVHRGELPSTLRAQRLLAARRRAGSDA